MDGMKDVAVNQVADGAGILNTTTQVTSVSFTQADGTPLSYAFPQNYMKGLTSACKSIDDIMGQSAVDCTPSGTRKTKIVAQAATDCGSDATGFYIEYGFDMIDLDDAGKWFAYDPEVAREGKSGLVSKADMAASSSLFLLVSLFAIATWGM